MTLDEVNNTIDQPQRSDNHRGHRPRWYHNSGVDKSWY